MKKNYIYATILALALSVSCLSGCKDNSDTSNQETNSEATETKQITCEELTMNLASDYKEESKDSYDIYYTNNSSICIGIREPFDKLKDNGIEPESIDDYAKIVLEKSEITADITSYNDNTRTFTWVKTINDKEYTYLGFITRSSGAYWLIQFACLSDSYNEKEAEFKRYYDSVELK